MKIFKKKLSKNLTYGVLILASMLCPFPAYAERDVSKEIKVIEELLNSKKFEKAKKFARDTTASNRFFKTTEAFVNFVAGDPVQTLTLLNSMDLEGCAGMAGRMAELSVAEDYENNHCFHFWSLQARSHFVLQNWPKVIQSIEVLEQVNKPNPIDSELILYVFVQRIANLNSPKLDASLSDWLNWTRNDLAKQLAIALVKDQEKVTFKFKDWYEFSLTTTAGSISANLIHKKGNGYDSALELLQLNIPAGLNGPNLEIGLLRYLAKNNYVQKQK